MWMETLDNGKFKYAERYTDPFKKKTKKVSITLTSSSRRAWNEAQRTLNSRIDKKLAEYEREKATGFMDNNKLFSEALDEWFYDFVYKPNGYPPKGSTVSNYSYMIGLMKNNYTVDEMDVEIKEMSFKDIQKIYDRLFYEYNFSVKYIKKFKLIIFATFNHAYKNNYIKNLDPINLSRIPKPARTIQSMEAEKVPRYLERDELEYVLDKAKELNKGYHDVFYVQAYTGLRIGECLAVEEKDFESTLLYIRGTYDNVSRSSTKGQKTIPKTSSSFRKVYINKNIFECVSDRIETNKLLPHKGNDYVFTTVHGNPYDISVLNTFLNKVKKELNIETNLSTHIFRHTHISMLAELGVPLNVIMERVGHSDRGTTEKIYTHITNKSKSELIEKLNLL